MSVPKHDDSQHEVVISFEQAEQAQQLLGVPLRAGDRVRFEVIDGGKPAHEGPSSKEPWPPPWFDSIQTDQTDLSTTFRQVIRDEIPER